MERSRCTYAPYSYTHVELYKHRPRGKIDKGDILITHVGVCTEDNKTCNALRERLSSLTFEEWQELLRMAEKVDDMLDGTVEIR